MEPKRDIVALVFAGIVIALVLFLDFANPERATPSPEPVVTASPSPVASRDSTAQAASRSEPALAAKGEIAQPIIGGHATWYAADGQIAAAGPLLREYIGRNWRGALVQVNSGGRSVVVRLSDWCACRHGRRLIDLSDDAFSQLAPLSRGVIDVSITRVVHRVPDPPPTDTE